jgi:hypothetical protein
MLFSFFFAAAGGEDGERMTFCGGQRNGPASVRAEVYQTPRGAGHSKEPMQAKCSSPDLVF